MEFNRGYRIEKKVNTLYRALLILSISLFALITAYKIYLYFNYDINGSIIDSFHIKKVSNSLLTPEITSTKKDDKDIYCIEFKKVKNTYILDADSNYFKCEDGRKFFISHLDALKLVNENFDEKDLKAKKYLNIPVTFKVYKNGEFQRNKVIKFKVPLSLDDKMIKPAVKEIIRQKQRVTIIDFDDSMSFLNITTDNKYVSKNSIQGFVFNQNAFIQDFQGNIKNNEEALISFKIDLMGTKVAGKEIKLSINTIPYIDKELMTPKLGVKSRYLDEIHTLEFTPVEGVDIRFLDNFIEKDSNGKYSFKSINVLKEYNKNEKPSIKYTANFEFISHGRIIGKNKVSIGLNARTPCALDEIEPITFNDSQIVSGYVPSGSTVYVNEEEVQIDTSDQNGYSFSTEVILLYGENSISVKVERQGEQPFERTFYISKLTEYVEPEIDIPELTYSDTVYIYMRTLPSYTLYINEKKLDLDDNGSVSISYNLVSGYGEYEFEVKIYDEFDNLVFNSTYKTVYTSGY